MSDSTVMRRLSQFSALGQDPSDSVVTAYSNLFLDSFAKRDLVAFFCAHPDTAWTLPELERRLKIDRAILLGQLRGLKAAGLVNYHYSFPHTQVWHLASTRWANWIARAVEQFWARRPEKRNIIVHYAAPPATSSDNDSR
jgi:hypothetical protein